MFDGAHKLHPIQFECVLQQRTFSSGEGTARIKYSGNDELLCLSDGSISGRLGQMALEEQA
jgi:hypothetical protein